MHLHHALTIGSVRIGNVDGGKKVNVVTSHSRLTINAREKNDLLPQYIAYPSFDFSKSFWNQVLIWVFSNPYLV